MDVHTPSDKALKFRRLAEHRVSAVLRRLRSIGNLARPGAYDYSNEQIDAMFDAMRDELEAAHKRFTIDPQAGFRFE
jgi:hypothetical protein